MSFITKRDRVFNEYELFDLPSRNEGKLKAYSSCTDARAWSHFGSDKTEHLVEIIKRNNETCRAKYVPTDVIVDTLMAAKNAEIVRLKRKIEEGEQLIAAYDQLDLTSEQKCEIANAHAAIKAANKELDELYLNLDLSNYTEVSEGFETGKSSGEHQQGKGDECPVKKENQCTQIEVFQCPCDVSTNATDPRIDEMQDTIISKDAKLNAMQNTIAVMKNVVCEPYCIYAHIYTALEKIFGILCQNEKYRFHLSLMTSGKDTRSLDIKGKILFKLKVLEKFSLALIAPCSQDMASSHFSSDDNESCACFRAEVITHVETYALPSVQQSPSLDCKRAHLVADIMQQEEIKEILSKDRLTEKTDTEVTEEDFALEDYDIETENLKRLKSLQLNYEDLMTCYENLKFEKDALEANCKKYDDLEKDYIALQMQLKEYNCLWTEKEHYRRRSDDLDSLKEQYLVLSEETSNLETQLKAESEINLIKSGTIEDLRSINITLERKLNDATIAFEKEKNSLQCKLKEMECQIMCQEQQIKSLSTQIDRLLEHDRDKGPQEDSFKSIVLLDEMEGLKDQIKNLKDALFCSEEEKQQLQEQFQNKLQLINQLKMEVEDWKSSYDKTLTHNNCLEKCSGTFRDQIDKLMEENKLLSKDIEDKNNAVANLMGVIKMKSEETNALMNEIDLKNKHNKELLREVERIRDSSDSNLALLQGENKQTLDSLRLAEQESKELLEKVKNFDDLVQIKEDLSRSYDKQSENCKELREQLESTIEENKKLQTDLEKFQKTSAALLQENARLRDMNEFAVSSIQNLEEEKIKLTCEIQQKSSDLEEAFYSAQLSKKESEEMLSKLQQSETMKQDIMQLSTAYNKITCDKLALENELNYLKKENDDLMNWKKMYDNLLIEKNELQGEFDLENQKINHLYTTVQSKNEENKNLADQIKALQLNELTVKKTLEALESDRNENLLALEAIKNHSEALMIKLRDYETLTDEFGKLKKLHEQIKLDKSNLQEQLDRQLNDLKMLENENKELNIHNKNLLAHNEDLEKSLINLRNEMFASKEKENPYANILKEVDEMKKEKVNNQNKIRNLLDKLEESEQIISNLSEDILMREEKISILENHINSLKAELSKLQNTLSVMVDTGEEMKDSYHKVDQSLFKIEAHHSKATHNMKMELAKLQNENAKLEQQLSDTKLKTDESFRHRHKYASKIMHLENEREIIVTDIKQLEMESVGDTKLSPENCSTEIVLGSLDRIRKYIQAKNAKSNNLEDAILKVQTSSQLLLSKADEAKKILEKEQQKIIKEKEEAIAASSLMEKQLNDLKNKLDAESARDKSIIKDLEAEISNQKLIIDKINQSTQSFISKLQDELKNLHELYQGALEKISTLQDTVQSLTDDKIMCNSLVEKLRSDLEQKIKDVLGLQYTLDEIQNKEKKDIAIQKLGESQNMSSQTDKPPPDTTYNNVIFDMEPPLNKHDSIENNTDLNILKIKRPHSEKIGTEYSTKQKHAVNEVQILAASMAPTFDFVRNTYWSYKLKRLGHGRLEQYSISGDADDAKNVPSNESSETGKYYDDTKSPTTRLLDLYNRQSRYTDSSKLITENVATIGIPQSTAKSSAFTLEMTNDAFDSNTHVHNYVSSTSDNSTDKDLFLIYRDSENSNAHRDKHDKQRQKHSHNKGTQEALVGNLLIDSENDKHENHQRELNDHYFEPDTRNRTSLHIQSPKDDNNTSFIQPDDNMPIHSRSKKDQRTTKSGKESKTHREIASSSKNTGQNVEDKSHHRLSRVDANFILLKDVDRGNIRENAPNFGLEFLLDSVECEDPQQIKTYNTVKSLRKSQSDAMLSGKSNYDDNQYMPEKTTSGFSQEKSVAEQSVLTEMDSTKDYEQKIQYLTTALQNIEKDYKKKIDAIKAQYDTNIKNIINEHNHGVKSIQNLHEETLQDIIKIHENEVENLRSMSIDAMRKADKLEKENTSLKTRIRGCCGCINEEPVKISTSEIKRRRSRRSDTANLSKTNVEAFNVKPKPRFHGPCTCSLDVNISDTIRNIFQQVDEQQRKMAEHSYLKYIANKILAGNVESLDSQELSFLHLKVCRSWKTKIGKEEALQKKIDSLETELMNKQRYAQEHIAQLDRQVAEERRRLQEVREAVCRSSNSSRIPSPVQMDSRRHITERSVVPEPSTADVECKCSCTPLEERRSAGDIPGISRAGPRIKRTKESNRAVLAKLDLEEARERKTNYSNEPPTRLRRADRAPSRNKKFT